jgi:DNA repair protein RadD
LVKQNAAELAGLWPGGDIGIYSAGLRRRDVDCSITYASIDSIYDKWGEFQPFDLLIVDEAHRIPARGEGKYRQFIKGCRRFSPHLRVVGFTATPYRMGGPICHRDHILHEVCYDANVGDLIRDGFLCRLRSKIGDVQPDLDAVRRNSGGDYVVSSLAHAVDTPEVVRDAVASAMALILAENRQSIVFFCVDVQHCKDVSMELRKYGLHAPIVTGKTPIAERDAIAESFKAGRYRAICNVNVYTEGFNAKRVDCVVLFRPTLSKGLYVQMVGRGLRLHPAKEYCLVLDYANIIETHGPIDCIETGDVKLYNCPECGNVFSRAIRQCPACDWEIPPQEVERHEAEEREKQMHETKAANREILGSEPEVLTVDDVSVHRHRKAGKPDSIRVHYRCGLSQIREWVCLDHGGHAERCARRWWELRFGAAEARTISVDAALQDMFLGQRILETTETITVVRKGKRSDIIDHGLRKANHGTYVN